jgi:3-oxoacyl-[acyl-carrier protein] reductase
MRLSGKVALVTGSATGIGRGIALALAHEGATVAVNYTKSRSEAEATLREIEAVSAKGLLVQADVSQDDQVRRMVQAILDQFQRIDILVNNAGITRRIAYPDLEAVTGEAWDAIFNVNVKGTFLCCRAVAPIMKKLGEGCIINLASVAGITSEGSSIPYAASKAAVISLTKSLSRALAPEIRVNAIAPGFVPTRWNAGLEQRHPAIIAQTPLGRLPLPEDMGGVAVALATDARFVTGQTIVVDGGKI